MQLSCNFSGLALLVLALASAGNATPLATPGQNETTSIETDEITTKPMAYILSDDQMNHWIANTDAELNFIGEPYNPLGPQAALSTRVVYCNRRIDNICGGFCTVYHGGPTCLPAPGTECLYATSNVGYCTESFCSGTCNQLSTCRTMLSDGYCFTPSTNSIVVGV